VAASLRDRLQRAKRAYVEGSELSAISFMEQFVARARNQVRGDAGDLAARDALIRAAEQILAELRDADADEDGATGQTL
jgi:hypothetical protein